MCCIDRAETPYKCCCGCTVRCGVITLGVLQCLSLVSAILYKMWPNVGGSAVFVILFALVMIYEDSYKMRRAYFLANAIVAFFSLIVFTILLIVLGAGAFCGGDAACEDAIRGSLAFVGIIYYIGFFAVTYPILMLYQAFADEIEGQDEGYTKTADGQ